MTTIMLLIACMPSTVLVLAAGDPNDCVQMDYRMVCPIMIDPNVLADPNVVAVLGPVPNDPNIWTILPGTFRRPLATCDPDGDPVLVTIQSSYNNTAKVVGNHLEMRADAGVTAWAFIQLTDVPPVGDTPETSVILIIAKVRGPNRRPVLR